MDFKNTVIELMANTDFGFDLTSYIPQLESALNEGLQKATGGRISAYVCDTKDVGQLGNEPPVKGRRFGGRMFLDHHEYTYYICFHPGLVCGRIGDKKRAVWLEPLKENNLNFCLGLLAEDREAAKTSELHKWYNKLPDADWQGINKLSTDLKDALEKSHSKILVGKNGLTVVPEEIEVHYGSNDPNFITLDESEFPLVDLPFNVIKCEDEYIVAPTQG